MRAATAMLLLAFVRAAAGEPPAPIIDVHLHAAGANSNGPAPTGICAPPSDTASNLLDPSGDWATEFVHRLKEPACPDPLWGPVTDEGVMRETLAILERRNVYALTSGPAALLEQWKAAAPRRVLPALGFAFASASVPSPPEVERWLGEKRYVAFAEVGIQYQGVSPSDAAFEPYLAAVERAGVPMGIHVGTGPPGAPYLPGLGQYRGRLHSPLILEEALLRHPKLRVYLMHAGWPMLDDLLALLWTHPQVHVDVGVISYAIPRKEFHRYLQRIVESGFGRRVMFGSDQMNWPGAIERAIEAIETAPFLTEAQKRDILFDNAARFLRLGPEEIARMRGE